jgi:photosystem II stability/assembly factor-like uncharacterized protein
MPCSESRRDSPRTSHDNNARHHESFLMMIVALRNVLVVARRGGTARWTAREQLEGKRPLCIALDPINPERIYCGTANHGLWISDDAGESWRPAAAAVPESRITALAVARAESRGRHGVVYIGTEPSVVYRSEDGGESWQAMDALKELPSAPTWSFPPRPDTHHVRWLEPDPHRSGRIFACIEAGALVRSDDRGRTWRDRVPDGPYDTHTLATHPALPGRLYSAAGDGYFESDDAGDSWREPDDGLRHHYLFGVAVDPQDPETVLVSAAPGPFKAYDPPRAESAVYRKSAGGEWTELRGGLPDGKGTTVSVLAATAPGEFWAANNRGVYRSGDGGEAWERLAITWPDAYTRSNVLAFSAL